MLPLLAALCVAPPPPTVWLALFACQTNPYKPQKTHTFATLMRGNEIATISWLPATMKVRGLAVCPETGHNWTLSETFDWACRGGMYVSVWGPYPVKPELYDCFHSSIACLESGRIRYKSLTGLKPNRDAMNCVNAVQSVVLPRNRNVGPFGYGETATRETLDLYSPYILNWTAKTEVLPAMGVNPDQVLVRPESYKPSRRQNLDSFIQP